MAILIVVILSKQRPALHSQRRSLFCRVGHTCLACNISHSNKHLITKQLYKQSKFIDKKNCNKISDPALYDRTGSKTKLIALYKLKNIKRTIKKILFSILAVAAFAFTASAQDTGFGYGVKAGINIANLTNSDGNYKVGFTGGIFADYRFSNLFALSADVLYSRQGAKGDDAKIKTDNLNIPILANFYLVKGLAVKAGVQPGFLLGANDGMKDAFKTFDLAVPVGVSYDFNCGLILDARYNIGVTKVAKAEYSDDSKIRNSVFAVTAGWRF